MTDGKDGETIRKNRFMDVFGKRDGRWQIVAGHSSGILGTAEVEKLVITIIRGVFFYRPRRNIMKFKTIQILVVIFILAFVSQAQTAEQWRADLHFLAEQMPKVHPNLFHYINRAEFDSAVKKLNARIPKLNREQIIVEMQRIVVMVGEGEGHTQIGLTWDNKIGFRQYPLRLYLYSDGLFVRAASTEFADAVGKKVVKIGKFSAPDVMKIVRPLAQHDNEMTVKDVLPNQIVIPEVLYALGIIENQEQAKFTLADETGKQSTIDLKPIARNAEIKWIRANEKSSNPLPLYLKNRTENFWFEYLKDLQTVYVQFNAVQDKENETIAEFFQKVVDFVKSNSVNRLVLDIRLNNGGDNTLIKPIIQGIINSDKINRKGRFFTIIGRLTFSAAQNLANALEKETNTLFVGEPTGGKPNHYGDATNLVLPNSKITVRVSTIYWQDMPLTDIRQWIAPQIKAALSSNDYQNNRDPALEAILSYQIKP